MDSLDFLTIEIAVIAGCAFLIWLNSKLSKSEKARKSAQTGRDVKKSAEEEALQLVFDLIPLLKSGKLKEMSAEDLEKFLNFAKEKYPNLSAKLIQKTIGQYI